ncbi:MAG: hypothetical protein AAFU85_22610 [Planctomycetota bacterium]
MWNNDAQNPYTSSRGSTAMATPQGVSSIKVASKTGLIITFALTQGLLVIAGICAFMGLKDLPAGAQAFRIDMSSILYLAIGFGVFFVTAVLSIVLPVVMKAKADHDYQSANEPLPEPLNDDTELPPAAQAALGAAATRRLISQALLEGGANVSAVFMVVESNLIFAIPVIFAFIGIGLQAPFPFRVRAVLENVAMTR